MKTTQHELILAHLKLLYASGENDGWIRPMFLRGREVAGGFIGDAVDVRLRELRREGKVESRKVGKFEEFRIIPELKPDPPPKPTQLFIPATKLGPKKWWEKL